MENILMFPLMILYSLPLIFSLLVSLMYAPYGFEYSSTDYFKTGFIVTHILFSFFSIINWRFQKIILLINLIFYTIIMAFLIWILTENDINLYIYFFIILWFILFVLSINKFLSLTKLSSIVKSEFRLL
jgi:hypothetical protein